MNNERGSVALLAVLLLISLIGLVGYAVHRSMGMSAATGMLYQGNEEAYYVAEAGIQNVLWNLRRCMPVTGLVDKPFGNGSYTVTAVRNLDNSVSVVSAGQAAGAKATIERRIATTTNFTDVLPVKDSFIDQNNASTNYNNLTYLLQNQNRVRVLLYTDLSTIPQTALIQSAVLSLYLYSTSQNDTMDIFTVSQAWVDSEVTWTNRSAGTPWTIILLIIPIANPGGSWNLLPKWTLATDVPGWKTLDITGQAQLWLSGSNYGLIMNGNTGLDYFYSSQYTVDPSLVPKLTLNWSCS